MNEGTTHETESDSAVALPRAGDLVENRFRVEGVLGRGRYAVVYAAINVVTGKSVALKWPRRPAMFGAMLREAQAAARVLHPSVIDIYDVGEHGGALFLVMERVRAPTLGYQLARGALGLRSFLSVLGATIDCLRAVHESGLVHCDLKPSNILVSVNGSVGAVQIKLIDFGSVKLIDLAGGSRELRRNVFHPGTPPYAAPEQLSHSVSVDQRADIYALGTIIRRALCGSAHADATWPSLDEAVRQATHEDPSFRFRSVGEFGDALLLGRACRAM